MNEFVLIYCFLTDSTATLWYLSEKIPQYPFDHVLTGHLLVQNMFNTTINFSVFYKKIYKFNGTISVVAMN